MTQSQPEPHLWEQGEIDIKVGECFVHPIPESQNENEVVKKEGWWAYILCWEGVKFQDMILKTNHSWLLFATIWIFS